MPAELPVAPAAARVARRPFATADGRARARLAAQRSGSDLRADPSGPVDGPARQPRHEGRRRSALSRRARDQVLPVAGLRAREEGRPLGDGGRARRDEPAVRALPREDRAGVGREGRRAPAEEVAVGAALGKASGAGQRVRARDAVRAADLPSPARRVRPAGSGACARAVHPRRAGRGRVRHEAAVLRAQPQAARRHRAARAQVAPAGRAGRRRTDLRVLRSGDSGGHPHGRRVRALVSRRGEQGRPGGGQAAAAVPVARRPDAPRGGRRDDRAVPEARDDGRRRDGAHVPLRARHVARRRDARGAAVCAEPGRRAPLRMARAGDAEGEGAAAAEVTAAEAAPALRAAARVRGRLRRAHGARALRRGRPRRGADRRRARRDAGRDEDGRLQARDAARAPVHELQGDRRARPPARDGA
ncbi:LigA [Burkholderia ambifaria MEX-5]|uniref:LigA n=1 Tax=Burkholderia ambifaria MEX-5 TaxID=396597 RepID=B1TFY4_9BURK|nr:LigA [Burkholderia ambifaria MEX-5]